MIDDRASHWSFDDSEVTRLIVLPRRNASHTGRSSSKPGSLSISLVEGRLQYTKSDGTTSQEALVHWDTMIESSRDCGYLVGRWTITAYQSSWYDLE